METGQVLALKPSSMRDSVLASALYRQAYVWRSSLMTSCTP